MPSIVAADLRDLDERFRHSDTCGRALEHRQRRVCHACPRGDPSAYLTASSIVASFSVENAGRTDHRRVVSENATLIDLRPAAPVKGGRR